MNKVVSLIVFLFALASFSCSDAQSGDLPQCLMHLLPCLEFLQNTNLKLTAECCLPLKKVEETDEQCLCSMINNQGLIASFNLTKQVIVDFPPRCGLVKSDPKKCTDSGESGAAPAAGPVNPEPSRNSPVNPPSSNAGIGSAKPSLAKLIFVGVYVMIVIALF